eukprot:gene24928-1625_t
MNFWDKDNRQRLKEFRKANAEPQMPIPAAKFNARGNLVAYALSYDWSKGITSLVDPGFQNIEDGKGGTELENIDLIKYFRNSKR